MGHLVEKYNSAYFLRKDEEGNDLPYGVEGIESFLKGELRQHDREILEHVRFAGANVLEFGFGRGETIKYIWEQGAASYTGIDFSESACTIARDFLAKYSIFGPTVVCADALDFIRSYGAHAASEKAPAIDVVVMLDFVEHVPRAELREILLALHPIVSANVVLVINTPDFSFDNDVIADGLDENGLDSSDFVEETRGMHCNRYTLESLRRFFVDHGYLPVSRGHYFSLPTGSDTRWSAQYSYRRCWDEACARGVRLQGEWPREEFEITYEVPEPANLHRFDQANMKGLALYVVPSYLEYYKQGNYDDFLIDFLSRYDLARETIFDLGAFVGVNSMQFARLVGPHGAVCAFEPNPFNADRLRLNVSENPELGDRILVFPLALANSHGKTKFKVHRNVDAGISSASHLEGAHTTLTEEQLSHFGFTEVDVDVVTLDDFVAQTGFSPRCLKIDIEGAEHLALAGGINVLRRYRPILLVELHSIYCAIATLKLIMPLGYSSELLQVEPDGRCFIGATIPESGEQPLASLERITDDRIALEQLQLELAAAKARMESSTGANQTLSRANQTLTAERKRLQTEKQQLEQEGSALRDEMAEAMRRLDEERRLRVQQEEMTAAVQGHLRRYQMFPPIRMARKLRRLFG